MLTIEEIELLMDSAEAEIKAVLKKYNLEIWGKFEEVVFLRHEQPNEDFDPVIYEREAFSDE